MAMPNPDPLLVATLANEQRIADQGTAAADRRHISEDRDAARARAETPRRSALARIRDLLDRRR